MKFFSKTVFFLLAVIAGLSFFALRENERRVSAEVVVDNLKRQSENVAAEKDGVIEELQTQVSLLNAKITEAEDRYQFLLIEKNQEAADLNSKIEDKDSQIFDLQAQITELRGDVQFEQEIRKKTEEALKAAAQKQKDSEGQRQSLEGENENLSQRIQTLQKTIRKLENERAHLLGALKARESEAVPEPAPVPATHTSAQDSAAVL